MSRIPQEVLDSAMASYLADNEASLQEIAMIHEISSITLSRALAENGYKTLRKYKTEEEYKIIELLKTMGISTKDQLNSYINS